jgi:Na+-translocating ferredoxin:NAD+ oxidoreductase RNF subunit RnfB
MSLLSWLLVASRKRAAGDPSPRPAEPAATVEQRWLPVIDRDNCLGCERCVAACDHGCLEMIWSFATLTQPHNCTGEGRCTKACPQQIIQMAWVPMDKSNRHTPCAVAMSGATSPH